MVVGIILLFTAVFSTLAHRRMDYALIGVATLLPAYLIRFSFFGIPSTLLEVMILSVFAVWVIKTIRTKGRESTFYHTLLKNQSKQRVIIFFMGAIGLFLVSGLLSIFVAPSFLPAAGLYRAYLLEPILLFIVCVDTMKTRTHIFRVLSAMILSAFIVSMGAIVQFVTGWGIPAPWLLERRTTSLYPFPNAVGLFVAPLIPLMLTLLAMLRVYVSGAMRVAITGLFSATVAVSIAAIAVSKTEGAIVALVSVAFLVGLYWNKTSRYRTLWFASICIAMVVVSPPLSQFVSAKLFFKDDSGRVRRIMWKESAAMLSDRWLFGAGLAGYKEALTPYHNSKKGIEIYMYPHTIGMNFLTELGSLGLISFAAIIVILMSLLIRCVKYDRIFSVGLFASLAVLLIHGLVDVPYFKNDLSAQFWILAALIVTVSIHKEQLVHQGV